MILLKRPFSKKNYLYFTNVAFSSKNFFTSMALSQHRYSAPRYTPSMMSSGVP